MSITLNGTTGISGVDGSASTPALQGNDTNTGIFYPAADTIAFAEGGTEVMRIDSSGNVGIGTTSPNNRLIVNGAVGVAGEAAAAISNGCLIDQTAGFLTRILNYSSTTGSAIALYTGSTGTSTERMRIDSDGNANIGKTAPSTTVAGTTIYSVGAVEVVRNADVCYVANRLTNDGDLFRFFQAGTQEGSISVSGTTVSYNGGHISRWSQLYNETEKVNVYRGTVLESVNAMCVWEKDGELLPNEQATKTIVSTTVASKAVAGVFDRYDEDDENNPYDFYVAQSGDFVIRIAQGVTVQNGDLLESAGDGTAKPQADDICRSSTIAKVTSNYVSATYEDGSYCVPCILMIG